MNSEPDDPKRRTPRRRPRSLWRYRRRLFIRGFKRRPATSIALSLLLAYLAYELVTRVFIYSRDAYVTTDIILVAPEVAGPIVKLPIVDNQAVPADAPLFFIDPTPFGLALDKQRAALAVANASLKKSQDQIALAANEITSAQAVLTDAQKTKDRVALLSRSGTTTPEALDDAEKTYRVALALLDRSQNMKAVATQDEVVQRALIGQAQAAVALAEFELKKTKVLAPAAGRVAPLRIRAGQYVTVGKPALAIVVDNRWRLVVNLPEKHLPGLAVGQRVWYSVSSDSWLTFHGGTVRSIAPGIARTASALDVLPYVEPTTDWVRLPRRFPVEIDLDPVADRDRLFQGADATIWMIKLPWRK